MELDLPPASRAVTGEQLELALVEGVPGIEKAVDRMAAVRVTMLGSQLRISS